MLKKHYLIALICWPFFDCLGTRIGILFFQILVDYMKQNEFHFYYFFFLIGFTCCLILWFENRIIWNKVFKLKADAMNYWIISPGLASGVISTWSKNHLVFDCVVLCY